MFIVLPYTFLVSKMQFMILFYFHKARVVIWIFFPNKSCFCYQKNCKTFGGKFFNISFIYFLLLKKIDQFFIITKLKEKPLGGGMFSPHPPPRPPLQKKN
jgi:hypothetical protein